MLRIVILGIFSDGINDILEKFLTPEINVHIKLTSLITKIRFLLKLAKH